MTFINKNIINKSLYFLWIIFAFSFLYFLKTIDFLYFHTFIELVSIVIGGSIFLVTWNTKSYIKNNYLFVIGVSFLFISIIDSIHTLSYKGIYFFKGYDADLPTQFWIIARYIQSLTFFLALFFIKKKKVNSNLIVIIYTVFTAIFVYLPFYRFFPSCFVEGSGLTSFKKISEYIISVILLISIILIFKNKDRFDEKIFYYIVFSLILNIIAEIFFTFYISVYGISNIIGHYFKLASYYLFYKAIIVEGIRKPFNLIFKELNDSKQKFMNLALTDEFTGCYNRRACFDLLNKNIYLSKREKSFLTICLFDMDNLKKINDIYGHLEGDRAIKTLVGYFKKNNRLSDYICRIGGDEFLIIMPGCSRKSAENMIKRVKSRINKKNSSPDNKYKIDFSYGFAEYFGTKNVKIDSFIEEADNEMYKYKNGKKKRE